MNWYPIKLTTHINKYVFGGRLIQERLSNGPYFALERWTLTQAHIEPEHPWRCLTLSNIGTSVRIEYQGGSETLACGESCIIPAALSGVGILPTGQPESAASLIACYVPDLESDISYATLIARSFRR